LIILDAELPLGKSKVCGLTYQFTPASIKVIHSGAFKVSFLKAVIL